MIDICKKGYPDLASFTKSALKMIRVNVDQIFLVRRSLFRGLPRYP